jgi:GT2 family glycosyltransferase/glycosyltransferase involved in cell wall biosynthesis
MVYPDIAEAGYSGFSWSLALAPKYTGWMTIKIWVYPENEEKICSFARKVEVINGEISDRPRWENLASYERWRANNTLTPKLMTKMRQDAERLRREKGVKISIVVPVYNTPSHLLKEMLDSVTSQIYPDWELCIADDASSVPHVKAMLEQAAQADTRIKVVYRSENGHFVKATNSALEMAEGEYIALLDHDDLLSADALLQVAECVAKFPTVDWIYTDEDKIDESGHHYDPQMKGEWSPEMALTHNYTHHLTVIRRSLVTAIGGLRTDFKGAQDLDLFLRVSEHTTSDRIKHIAQVCYHWRSHPESTASDGKQKEYIFQSAHRAIEEAIARRGLRAKPFLPRIAQQYGLCLYQLRWDSSLIAENPVTIIIPTKDRIDLLKRCLASLLKTLDPQFVKLIIINDRSVEPETETYLQKLQEDRIFDCRVLSSDQPEDEGFNYAYLMNRALDYIETDYILHLNNDVEAISPGWLEDMVGWMSIAGVGVVGAKLLYPNQTIQHAGVVIGPHDGLADHLFLGLPQKEVGYLCLPHGARNVAAVTGACLLTSTHLYRELGGFDQENFAVQYNDVDYCLRVLQAGKRVVYTPQACLIHQTSASRKDNYNHEEHLNFLKLYGNFQDPFWNESLDINSMFMGINPHRFIHGNRVKSPSIVIITHNLNYEGAPLMIYELAKYLKVQKQCSISFLSLQDGPLKARLEDLKIPVIITSELANIYEQEVVALEPILKRLGKEVNIKQFDLVIGNTLQSFWGIYLAHIFNLPSLWYIHESTSLELFSQAFKPCIQSIIRNCFVTAARTVFVADATRQLFHQLDREDRFRVIYGGINLQEIEEFRQNHNRDELRAKYGLLDDQIVISILGTTCERKGQHIFVQALKQLASLDPEIFAKVRGLVVGGRKGKYLDFLNNKITSLSLESQVQIYMETKNIYEFFSITDIFVCASSEESFPRVILEAMAFELKIVSTDVFGIKEMIIDNQEGYLIKPNNPQELAEAIRFCTTNPEHSALLARNGAIKVNRCFGNKQLLEKNFALIQETVLLSGGTEGMY